MPWRPLPRIAVAVAIFPFPASSPSDLPLEIGDDLYIIEQGGKNGDWYRGYLVAPPSLLAGLTSVKGQALEARVFSGIFPRCCVEIREHLGDAVPEPQLNGSVSHGDGARSDLANGLETARHQSPENRKAIISRKESSDSVKRKPVAPSGDISKEFGTTQRLMGTSSQTLARKLSHRSITSSRSRNSPVPMNHVADESRESKSRRPQAPVPMLKIGDETPTSASEPLVDEIASCLREWHSKDLVELLLSRRYTTLERLSALVKRLNIARRQLLYGVMTEQELTRLREEIVWDLVAGNKMLSDEVIVRDPSQHGRLLTGEDSPLELSRLQSSMSLLDRPPRFTLDPISLHHLLVDFKSFLYHGLASPVLVFQLFSRAPGELPKPLTECFSIENPPTEVAERPGAEGALRTLFTDLSLNGLEASAQSGGGIYLVVRLHANQFAQQAPRRGEDAIATTKPPNGSISGSSSAKGGRQSLMWAQKQFSSVRGRTNSARASPAPSISEDSGQQSTDSRPGTGRPPTQDSLRPPTQQGGHYVKRTVGAGVLDLRKVIGQKTAIERHISIWVPAAPSSDSRHPSDDQWDDLIKDLVSSRSGLHARAKDVDGLDVALQLFEHPDAQELISKTPTLLQNITQTPKTSFSGTPSKARSDIYLNISEATLPPHALLTHPERGTSLLSPDIGLRNIQLTLEVRKNNGERVEHCIFPSSNSTGQTAWRTTAVSRGEPWSQLIKVVLSVEDVSRCHLIMSIADAPGFPFALGWMPLWTDGAFVRDGVHVPLLYIYDKSTTGSDRGPGAYLTLPWSSKAKDGRDKEESLTGPVATLKLETHLCSTSFSQDQILLGILKWRQQQSSGILELLSRFGFIPEIEIVKMIRDVFNALFGILGANTGKNEFEDGVFNALVLVLSIVHDRRFNLGPFVDSYADGEFDHSGVAPCLIRSYLRLLSNPTDPSQSRRLRSTFKVGRQMLKFILRAREQQSLEEAVIGATTQSAFKGDLESVFHGFEKIMKDPGSALIGNKTLIVQHIPAWLPELKPAFSEAEIFDIAVRFVGSCANVQGKLILYKLVLILNLTSSNLFSETNTREKVTICTARWINVYWGSTSKFTEQWRDQVRLCCTIAARQQKEPGFEGADYVGKAIQSYNTLLQSPVNPKDTLSLLFPSMYPFASKPVAGQCVFDEARIELAALLAMLAGTPFKTSNSATAAEVIGVVSTTSDVVMSILSGTAFPSSWISLYVYHHRFMLRILENLFVSMVDALIPSPDDAHLFNTEIWRKFLTTLLNLVRSNTLALETFPEQKRRAIWKVAGDVREQGSELLRRSWEVIGWDTNPEEQSKYGLHRLGGFQVQYVPKLVGPIVELCLSVHEGLRSIAIKILQAMIISEWTLNEDLAVVQAEIIESLDNLFKTKNMGENMVQKMFVNELLDSFEAVARMPLDPLWQAVRDMVSTIDELLELLGSVHSLDISENLRIMNTLQLMSFLKDMQKEDIFIRYVHQLAKVQARNGHRTEAGLALALHAEQYTWDSTRVVPLSDPYFPEQLSSERKEQLYFEMIKYFEEGSAWENALASYQELSFQYDSTHYDFAKLARSQRSMAKIYETISKGDWQPPRYFKVAYHGADLPSNLRNKQYIYEAGTNERQSAFADRMRQLHPAAQVVFKGDIDENIGQCLQILPLQPYKDLEHLIYQQPRVAQATRDYVTSTKAYRFAVTSKRHSPATGVQDQWIEKTIYSTQDVFPCILRRSEIVATDVIRLTPLQTAIERTTRKTSELAAFEKRISKEDESALAPFYETISFSVDNTSLASVSQYRKLLPVKPETDADDDDSESGDSAVDPMQNALQIAIQDHVSTLKHCLSRSPPIGYHSTHTSLSDQLKATFAPELANLSPQPRATEADAHNLLASPSRSSSEVPQESSFAPTVNSSTNIPAAASDQDNKSTDDRARPFTPLNFNNIKGSFGSNGVKQDGEQSPIKSLASRKSDDSDALSHHNNSAQTRAPPIRAKPSDKAARITGQLQHYSSSPSFTNGSISTTTVTAGRPSTSHGHNNNSKSSKSLLGGGGTGSNSNNSGSGRVKRRLSLLGIGRSGSSGSGSVGSGGRSKSSKDTFRSGVEVIQE